MNLKQLQNVALVLTLLSLNTTLCVGQKSRSPEPYVTGKLATAPTQSWFGNSYEVASVGPIAFPTIALANSFWAFSGAGPPLKFQL